MRTGDPFRLNCRPIDPMKYLPDYQVCSATFKLSSVCGLVSQGARTSRNSMVRIASAFEQVLHLSEVATRVFGEIERVVPTPPGLAAVVLRAELGVGDLRPPMSWRLASRLSMTRRRGFFEVTKS